MFRLRRLLPHPQLFFRISPPSPRNATPLNVRHVKFRRPWIRRLFAGSLIYGTAFYLWSFFVFLQFDDAQDDADGSQASNYEKGQVAGKPEDNKQDHGSEESSDPEHIFLPLGWPQFREGKLYASSDPEWHEFVKISRNSKKIEELGDQLASIALSEASNSNILTRTLGEPLVFSRHWLVPRFPYRAPSEYSRSGLKITDTGISWASKSMPPEDGDRLRRCMRPLYLTLAIRDAYLVLLRRQLSRLNTTDSGQEKHPSSPNLPQHRKESSTDLNPVGGLNHVPAGPQEITSHNNSNARLHPSLLISTLQRIPLPKFGPGSDLYTASLAFKLQLNQYWGQELRTARRGVFFMNGPVGIRGPKGFCRLEVKGEYDPLAAKWSAVSLHLKDIHQYRQRAQGGP